MKKIRTNSMYVKSILSNAINIPEYQRAYEWKTDLIEGFFKDLFAEFENYQSLFDTSKINNEKYSSDLTFGDDEDVFYIGQVVKFKEDIVDGQQRLSSILIILKAIIDLLIESGHKNQFVFGNIWESGGNKPILKSSKADLEYSNKLFSEENWILASKDKERKKDVENSRFFKTNWFKNYQTVYQTLKETLKSSKIPSQNYENALLNLITFIRHKTWLTLIEINNVEDAVSFFEIMNSKSLPLTPADLIKNNFIKSQKNKESASETWNKVANELSNDSGDLTKYIRFVYICKYGYVSTKDLFTAATEKERNIVDDMSEYLESFKMISGKVDTDNLINDAQLNFIFNVGPRESLMPILLQIFKTHDKNYDQRTLLLNQLVAFSYKYFFQNGFKANAYSPAIVEICHDIANGKDQPFAKLFKILNEELKKVNKKDISSYDEVQTYFDDQETSAARKFAKSIYPLLFVKMNGSHDAKEVEIKKIEIASLDIEHIYPQTLDSTNSPWPFLDDKNLLWSIGNLLPISSSKNRAAKNSSFEIKYKYYTGRVNSKGETPSDDDKTQLSFSTLFDKLFVKIMPEISEKSHWNDKLIIEREKRIKELMKELDILYLNSGNK